MFARLLAGFAGVAIPAAVVNAGLKYCQKLIQLAFMRRLTHHLHQHYCSHRAYYAASTLGGGLLLFQLAVVDVANYTGNVGPRSTSACTDHALQHVSAHHACSHSLPTSARSDS